MFEEEGGGDRHARRMVAACRDEWHRREEDFTGKKPRKQRKQQG